MIETELHFTKRLAMVSPPTDRCIVLPLRPEIPGAFTGVGPALHFLIGNVLVLHTGFKEMWFGWRAKKIFPQPEELRQYCRDAAIRLDLARISREQKIRLWLYGSYTDQKVSLHCFDSQSPQDPSPVINLPISLDDGLIRWALYRRKD
jgi:hypothetical protein